MIEPRMRKRLLTYFKIFALRDRTEPVVEEDGNVYPPDKVLATLVVPYVSGSITTVFDSAYTTVEEAQQAILRICPVDNLEYVILPAAMLTWEREDGQVSDMAQSLCQHCTSEFTCPHANENRTVCASFGHG